MSNTIEIYFPSFSSPVLLDIEDFPAFNEWKWFITKDGYVKTTSHPQVEPHRLFLDGNFKYDHINRNRLDYRKENLRPCNKSQNMANSKISKRNSSGYKGVSFDPSRNNWRAVICKRGKYITIGRYNTKEEAAEAYNLKAKELFGKFANLNVIIYANP